MLEKIREKLKKRIPIPYSEGDLNSKLFTAEFYAKDAGKYLTLISLAERVSSMDEKEVNEEIRRLKLEAETSRLKAVDYIDKNEEFPLTEIEKNRNRKLEYKHAEDYISKDNMAEILESARKDFLKFVGKRLDEYKLSKKGLVEYEKSYNKIVESADQFPEMKARIAKIDMMLSNIETLEREVFSNHNVFMLLSEEEQKRIREKYKLGENPQ